MFELGKISVSDAVRGSLVDAEQSADEFVDRHRAGDWGDVSEETTTRNAAALENGGRIESVYHTRKGEKILVSTEPDRSVTYVILPREF